MARNLRVVAILRPTLKGSPPLNQSSDQFFFEHLKEIRCHADVLPEAGHINVVQVIHDGLVGPLFIFLHNSMLDPHPVSSLGFGLWCW